MTLKAIKTTAGYVVEGSDQTGRQVELFFDKSETANYDKLVEIEQSFRRNRAYAEGRAQLPDPERDLYVTIFGVDNEPTDTALHTTLVEVQKARDGISLDWTQDSVTAALRLINVGEGNRLRLIAGRLVDMGPAVPVVQTSPVQGDPWNNDVVPSD